jgi:hypothetical protein
MHIVTNHNLEAELLLEKHGSKARQVVVDKIVSAVKQHDLDAAKRWEAVGQRVDELLAA